MGRHNDKSQSAFAGYGLKRGRSSSTYKGRCVAIRFRWIWVEKQFIFLSGWYLDPSQSAFAGYGLKRLVESLGEVDLGESQSAFAGYGLKRRATNLLKDEDYCRNPLSLDMG